VPPVSTPPVPQTSTPATPAATQQTSQLSVSSPVSRGATATATVTDAPGVTCTISYRTPSGAVSEAAGLGNATTDANGRASWSWAIGGSTNPGTGTVTVRCGTVSRSVPIVITT
jgi:hypothetical protein